MKRARRGFTLIEMLVVLAIMGLLAAAAVPLVELESRRAQERELREGLRTLRAAIDAYHAAALEGRVRRMPHDNGYPPSLEVLVSGVTDLRSGSNERIYFLRRLPRDPFADPTLPAAATWGLRSYDSPPDDPRPGKDVFDIHSLSPANGLDGTPYRSW